MPISTYATHGPSAIALTVVAVLGLSLLSGCGKGQRDQHLRVLEQRDPRTATVARHYGWQARAQEPQARWHPSENTLLVRSQDGLGILQEGAGGEFYTTLRGGDEIWDPQWWGPNRVVFGPRWKPRGRGAHFQMPGSGLVVAEVGMRGISSVADLLDRGYAPRPWDGTRSFAQYGEDILIISEEGEYQYFGKGFFPTPQPLGGPGLTYQVTPFPWPDHWTGREGSGELIIRWREGKIDSVRGGLQAAWTPDGRVLSTVVDNEHASGSRVAAMRPQVWLSPGPGEDALLLASGAHSPAPHPHFALAAVADAEDGIRLVSYDQEVDVRLARRGSQPQWNHDGSRLLVYEPGTDGRPQLRVLVLVWRSSSSETPAAER